MANVRELEAKIEGIEETLSNEPARRLLKYITRLGDYKGELQYLTPKMYKQMIGKPPKSAIVNKQGKIPWELALDDIATELGYSSDEALKKAVEKSRAMELQREKLKHLLAVGKEEARADLKCKATENIEGACSRKTIHGDWCKGKLVECANAEITAIKQPSLWRLHIAKVGEKPDSDNQVGEVRYAKEASSFMRQVARGLESQSTAKAKAGRVRSSRRKARLATSALKGVK